MCWQISTPLYLKVPGRRIPDARQPDAQTAAQRDRTIERTPETDRNGYHELLDGCNHGRPESIEKVDVLLVNDG